MPKIALTILLLFSTGRLFALGLGNIELNSSLNQPFDARIELLSPTSAEIDTLSVRLADLEAFNRAGIERVFILTSLQFEIEVNDSGPDYIRITSSEAIREPFLKFLLEASWSSGRLFREYTVLLDPPLYDPNTRRIAIPSAPASEPEPVRSSQTTSSTSISSAAPVASYSGDDYGPTGTDDTLWSIASRVRPDTGVTVQQMMLALLRANPEAFIENNINGLRQGQILRIPDRDDITSTSAEAALSQVQSQNSLWEEIRGSFATNVSQRPSGSASQPVSSAGSSTATSEDAELRLVSPGSDSGADAGQAAASFDSSGQGGADLALANEQLEALSSENSDLRGRLEKSEELIQDLQRLLELRDDELATLQQQTAGGSVNEEPEEIVEDVTEATADETGDAEAVPEEITSLALDEAEEPAPDTIDETPPAEEQASSPPAVTTQPEIMPAQPGLVDQVLSFIFGNLVLVGGGLGALIIAIAALLFIKKRKESAVDDELPVADTPDFESTAEETAMPEESSEIDSEIDAGDESAAADESDVIAADESAQEEEPVAEPEAEEAVQEEVEAPAEEPEDNPLAEVNVFLAYEHFDQAEEFVRDAIQGDPNNLDFHSKLLEVFYSSGDKAKYEEEAKVLNELTGGDGPHWEMATIMWQEISPNRELFAEPVDGEEEASDETKGGGIIDLTADEGGSEDGGLDFDLGTGDADQSGPAESDDGMLDITSGGDDVLDVTAVSQGEDLDSTMKIPTETSEDMDSTLKIPTDSSDDNSLDLDIGGEEISTDSGDDNVIDFDATSGETQTEDEGLEISLDEGDDDAGGIELDLGDDTGADTGADDGLDISLDEGDDDAGGIELDMSEDNGANQEGIPEISLDDDDDDDDEEDYTVFVPRTADTGEQSAEDEIATKLDLAKAYVELGDGDSANTILDEIIAEGNDEQKRQAEELKAQVS